MGPDATLVRAQAASNCTFSSGQSIVLTRMGNAPLATTSAMGGEFSGLGSVHASLQAFMPLTNRQEASNARHTLCESGDVATGELTHTFVDLHQLLLLA